MALLFRNWLEEGYYEEDEYCNLTLDKFIEKFGEEVINQNNITVDKY